MEPTTGIPEVLNLRETAEYLRISRPTLNRMIARGDLHVAEVYGMKRIRKSDLDALLAPKDAS